MSPQGQKGSLGKVTHKGHESARMWRDLCVVAESEGSVAGYFQAVVLLSRSKQRAARGKEELLL